jgi:hypothetical protein
MKRKYLRVTMPDSSRWDVPASLIAESRARYYAKHDSMEESGPEYDKVYREEYEYTINSDSELKDWAANNMNWSDVSANAARTKGPDMPDYQEGWVNGKKEVVTK